MLLVAFLQAANCSNFAASWRHPETDNDFLHPEFYQHIARVLEQGKFHMGFFDDRLAMPSRYDDSTDEAVSHGVRVVKLDLVPVLMAMALATTHLGLGATYSTTYYAPFHITRLFSTLDHFTRGRVAWNVVTSLNDSEAQNFGLDQHSDHDSRYDQADEALEIVKGLWDTWDDDALVVNKESGIFAKPESVRRLDYEGKFFNSRGPLTVPRTPQGHPVIMQAGQSERGREFASRWGELIFVVFQTIEACKAFGNEIRERAQKHDRNSDAIKIVPAIYVIVGETDEIAQEKQTVINNLVDPVDSLTLLSEIFNYDFAKHGMDEPLSDDDLEAISGTRGFLDRIVAASGTTNPTVADFLKFSGRGTLQELPTFVGTPEHVADQMEEWFTSGACDGFVVAATHMPGTYEDFVRLVVPELQKRGLFHNDYTGDTLRENTGLARP